MGSFFTGIETKVIVFFLKELKVLAADELVILETGITNIKNAISGGADWETALTAELNSVYTAEATEGRKIIGSFLDFIARVANKLHV